jgi:RHS repeat-associated protein
VVEAHLAFDSWGQRIEGGTGTLQPRPAIAEDIRSGFTGHEMLDTLGLVHMNGRLYDPFVGEFLSPDPVIQDITDSQAFNAYSYVRNNPLSSVDPTGYSWVSKFFKKLNKGVQKFLKAVSKIHPLAKLHAKADKWVYQNRVIITVVVVAVVAAVFVGPTVAGWAGFASGTTGYTVAAATVAGAVSSGARTALYGGKLRDILKSAAIGGVTAAISAGLLHPLGDAAANAANFGEKAALTTAHVAGHGLVGGAANAAQGGSFKEGFLSAAAGALLFDIPSVREVMQSGNMSLVAIAARTAVAGVVGGTVSVIGGGKFGNGAWTVAFQHLFNNEIREINHNGWKYILARKAGGHGMGSWLMDYAGNNGNGPSTIAFYDSKDETTAAGQFAAAGYYAGGVSSAMIDMRNENWHAAFLNGISEMQGSVQRVVFLDHGAHGRMGFGGREVTTSDLEFMSPHVTDNVLMLGCNTFGKVYGDAGAHLRSWAQAVPGRSVVGYSSSTYFSKYGAGTTAPTGPGGEYLHKGYQVAIRGVPIK